MAGRRTRNPGRQPMPAEPRLDALTALPGRVAWGEAIETERVRRARYRRPVAFLIIEVVPIGQPPDDAMVAAANLLRRGLRDADFVARIGDLSFGVVLPETSAAALDVVEARILEAAAAWRGADEAARISVGIGRAAPGPFDDIKEALRGAQRASRTVSQRP